MGFWVTKHRNTLSRSWLARSVWPLVWGWNPEDKLTVAPSSRQNSLQNLDTNWGPLSETTSAGRPWMRKTWSTTVAAVSLAEGNLGKGIKWAAFENRSTTVKTTVLLWNKLWKEPPNPLTSDAILPTLAWRPATLCYRCRNCVRQETVDGKKTRRDAPCRPRWPVGIALHLPPPLTRRPPPRTGVWDQGPGEWVPKRSGLWVW